MPEAASAELVGRLNEELERVSQGGGAAAVERHRAAASCSPGSGSSSCSTPVVVPRALPAGRPRPLRRRGPAAGIVTRSRSPAGHASSSRTSTTHGSSPAEPSRPAAMPKNPASTFNSGSAPHSRQNTRHEHFGRIFYNHGLYSAAGIAQVAVVMGRARRAVLRAGDERRRSIVQGTGTISPGRPTTRESGDRRGR